MKLSSHRTAEPVQSHVDLDGVRKALFSGRVSAHEARVATALAMNPELSGLRAIEVASGLCDDTVLNVLPADGESSTLLECSSRGVFAWDADDRRPMLLGHRSSVEHNDPSSSNYKNYVQDPLGPLEGLKPSKPFVELEEDEHCARRMTGLLDPSLDVWANVATGNAEDHLGDSGWVLAMVTGMHATSFALDELGRILRLGERQVRRVVDKLVTFGWAEKVREGRRVSVIVDFSLMADEDLVTDYMRDRRANEKAAENQLEAEGVREMATEAARMAREMWKNRLAVLRQLREYAAMVPGLVHDRLIELLDRPSDRKAAGWVSRWSGERQLRLHLSS